MPETDRRTTLADAAITTLARHGSRGLTHRAVDRAAGLVEGTTSYYFRTRQDLLEAVVTRLAELDAAALPELRAVTPAAFTDAFTDLVLGLLHGSGERQLARYELTFEARRRPGLGNVLAESSARIRELVAHQFLALEVADPDERARDFLLLVDGLLFDQLVAPWSRPRNRAELRTLVGRMLGAVANPVS